MKFFFKMSRGIEKIGKCDFKENLNLRTLFSYINKSFVFDKKNNFRGTIRPNYIFYYCNSDICITFFWFIFFF